MPSGRGPVAFRPPSVDDLSLHVEKLLSLSPLDLLVTLRIQMLGQVIAALDGELPSLSVMRDGKEVLQLSLDDSGSAMTTFHVSRDPQTKPSIWVVCHLPIRRAGHSFQIKKPVPGFSKSLMHGDVWVLPYEHLRVIPNRYVMKGSLYIPRTGRLILDKGTSLMFPEGAGIYCEGSIQVNGIPENPVEFSSHDPINSWAGIVLSGSGVRESWFRASSITGGQGHRVWDRAGTAHAGVPFEIYREGDLPRYGGNLLVANGATVELMDVQLKRGKADFGGGLAICSAGVRIGGEHGLRCEGNTAREAGGGLFIKAARCDGATSLVLHNNRSEHFAGGLYSESSDVLPADVSVQGNMASKVSGAFVFYSRFKKVPTRFPGQDWIHYPNPHAK